MKLNDTHLADVYICDSHGSYRHFKIFPWWSLVEHTELVKSISGNNITKLN
jgi:hypothetical protein